MKPKMGLIAGLIVAGATLYFAEFNNSVNTAQNSSTVPSTDAPSDALETAILNTPSENNSLNAAFSSMLDKKQSFVINGSREAVIQGKNGTICSFTDSTFMRADGSVVTGAITLELLECYDLKNILGAQLSTTSQDKIIETAGMINLVAYENGKPLTIRPGKNYMLQFPRQKQNDFVLFTGERTPQGIMDWTLIPDENKPVELLSSKMNIADSAAKEVFKEGDFIEIRHSYMRKHLGIITKDDHFRWRLKDGQYFNDYYVANFNPSLEMIKDFKSRNLTCEITFKVNDQGEVIQSYISKTSYTDWDEVLLSFVQNLPDLQIDLMMPKYDYDHDIKLEFSRGLIQSSQAFVEIYRRKNKWAENGVLTSVNVSDLNYYTFNTSKLGWINCDRFTNSGETLVDFQVKTSDVDSCNMSLIFDDMNSVLKGVSDGSVITFHNVPLNKSVRIFAVKCVNGSPTMCSQKAITTDEKTIAVDRFIPFSLKDLDKMLSPVEI